MKKTRIVVMVLFLCMVLCWWGSALAATALTVGDTKLCTFNSNLNVGYSMTSYTVTSSDTSIINVTDHYCDSTGMGSVTVQAVGAGEATVKVRVNAYYGKWDSVLGQWREDTQTLTSTFSFAVSAASSGGSGGSSSGSSTGSGSTPVASSGICGPMADYKLDNGVLTIYGTGEMFDYSSSKPAPWGQTAVAQVIVEAGITDIGDFAFYKNTNLTSVTLPSGLKTIGSSAFYGCDKIYAIRMPDSITGIGEKAFSGCKALTYANMPANLTQLGTEAFYNCDLQSVTIPAGVTVLPEKIFESNNNLTNVTIQGAVTEIGTNAFSGCKLSVFLIPDTVTTLGYGAFGYTSIESITIPDSVTSIGEYLFTFCNELTSVTLSRNIQQIPNCCFYFCEALTNISIPAGVTAIGDSAFRGCTALKGIEFPNSVTKIGAGTFYGCTALKNIKFPTTVEVIGGAAFENCDGLTELTLPDKLKAIEQNTFSGCDGLTEVILPRETINVNRFAFQDCTGLTKLVCNDKLNLISQQAFSGCINLTDVQLNRSVKLDRWAFENCKSIDKITIPVGAVIHRDAFSGCGVQDVYLENNRFSLYTGGNKRSDSYGWFAPGAKVHYADSGLQENGFYFRVEGEGYNKKLYLSGNGAYNKSYVWSDWENSEIDEIFFYSGVTSIGDYVIYGKDGGTYSDLFRIYLPSTIQSVGYIYSSDGLINLHYQGSEDDWDKVSSGGGTRLTCTNCTCFDYDAEPEYPTPLPHPDVNEDGSVDINDLLLIMQYSAGWNVNINTANADVNIDYVVDVQDAIELLKR